MLLELIYFPFKYILYQISRLTDFMFDDTVFGIVSDTVDTLFFSLTHGFEYAMLWNGLFPVTTIITLAGVVLLLEVAVLVVRVFIQLYVLINPFK